MCCKSRQNKKSAPAPAPTISTEQTAQAVAAGSQVHYEVDVDGQFSGRRFRSLLAANSYATSRGGTVRITS